MYTKKFGLEVPNGMMAARKLDIKIGIMYWQDDIATTEIKDVRNSLKILYGDDRPPTVYQKIRCNLIFI